MDTLYPHLHPKPAGRLHAVPAYAAGSQVGSLKTAGDAGTRTWRNRADGWAASCVDTSATTLSQLTRGRSTPSATTSSTFRDAPCAGAARRIARGGRTWPSWPSAGCLRRGYPTLGLSNASASNTRGGSRMREFRPYGSVRGAPSHGRPYPD
jgi:hypothetical protein